MNDDEIQQFNESIRALNSSMPQLITGIGVLTEVVAAQAVASGASKDKLDTTNVALKKYIDATSQATAAQKAEAEATRQLEKAMQNLQQATASAVKGFVGLGKAMLDQQEGFKKYGDSLNSLGDAALSVGKNFGVLGIAIGGVIKGATLLADKMAAQADSSLKAVDSVSKLGAANSFTAEEMRRMGRGAGLTSETLDKMIKPMQSASGAFSLIGKNSAEGVEKFGQMIAVTKDVRMEFQRLGMNDQERIQAQADYLSMLERTGAAMVGQQKTGKALQEASLEYTRNLYELSSFTGKSVEESKKQMEVARATLQWRLQENKWAREIQAAQQRGDKATVERLTNEKNAANKLINDVSKMGDPAKTAAVQMQYLTGAVTKQSSQFAVLGVDVQKNIEAAKRGTYAQGEFLDDYKKGAQSFMDTVGPGTVALSESLQKSAGFNEDTIGFLNKRMDVENETAEAAKNAQKIKDNQNNKGVAADDAAQKTRNELTEAERKAKGVVDDLTASLNPLLKGFNSQTTAVVALTAAAGVASAALVALGAKAGLAKAGEVAGKAAGAAGGAAAGGGRLATMAKGAGIGAIAGVGGTLLSAGGNVAKESGYGKTGAALDIAGQAASYAGTGAMIGSVIPGLGTAAGAAIGGIIGAGMGAWQNREAFMGGEPNGSVQRLLDFIGKHESGGDYNVLVGGKKANLTDMTVAEVLQFQDTMRARGHETTAVGKYQIIKNTLMGIMSTAGVKPTDKFDQSTQDKLGLALLKGRGLDQYQNKKIDANQFADNLAKEWASLPTQSGKSYYAGVGSNAAHASRADLIDSLPKAMYGGAFSGPSTGYPVELHGRNESVWPESKLKDLIGSVEKQTLEQYQIKLLNERKSETPITGSPGIDAEIMAKIYDLMETKFDTLIYAVQSGNSTQDKLLKYSRV